MSNLTGPLDGLRILDLSRILAGPTCTQLLGDMGAEVIKIERPEKGDDTRSWGPPFVTDKQGNPTAESAYFLSANRNKKSVALDIADPKDQKSLKEILATCDVLVENFKVGGLEKYGLSYSQLRDEFPKLVYCSITGYGQTGPNAPKAGYDLMAQGFGGIMSLTGEPDGQPMKTAVAICDFTTGLYASTAILAALRHVDKTGEGQQIDLALVDVQTSWLINQGTNYLMTETEPKRYGNEHPNIVPYQVFSVANGHIIVAVGNDNQFAKFCDVIDAPHLAADPLFSTNKQRLSNRDALIPILQDLLTKLEKEPLIAAMGAKGIPGGPINTLPEVFASDQVAAREMQIDMVHEQSETGKVRLIGNPIKFSQTPVTYRHAPPAVGQDTDAVLADLTKHRGKT